MCKKQNDSYLRLVIKNWHETISHKMKSRKPDLESIIAACIATAALPSPCLSLKPFKTTSENDNLYNPIFLFQRHRWFCPGTLRGLSILNTLSKHSTKLLGFSFSQKQKYLTASQISDGYLHFACGLCGDFKIDFDGLRSSSPKPLVTDPDSNPSSSLSILFGVNLFWYPLRCKRKTLK